MADKELTAEDQKTILKSKHFIVIPFFLSFSAVILSAFLTAKERQELVYRHTIFRLPEIKDSAAYVVSKKISFVPWEEEPYMVRVQFQWMPSTKVTHTWTKEIKTSSARVYASIGNEVCVKFKYYKNEVVDLELCD